MPVKLFVWPWGGAAQVPGQEAVRKMNLPASGEKQLRQKPLMPLIVWALEEAAVPGREPEVARRRKWQSSMDTCAMRQRELLVGPAAPASARGSTLVMADQMQLLEAAPPQNAGSAGPLVSAWWWLKALILPAAGKCGGVA